MGIKKQVYKELFRDSATAVDELNNIGFSYKGTHGLFKKYHRFFGLSIAIRDGLYERLSIDELEARLYPDGLVKLYVDTSKSSLLGMSAMPSVVYMTTDHYKSDLEAFRDAKHSLEMDYGDSLTLQWIAPRKCGVFEKNSIDTNEIRGLSDKCLIHFRSWREAYEWAVIESKNIQP